MVKESGYLRSRQGCKSAEPLYVVRATDTIARNESNLRCFFHATSNTVRAWMRCTLNACVRWPQKLVGTGKTAAIAGRATTVESFATVRGQRNSEIACPLIRKVKVLQGTVIVERYPPLLGLCFGMPNSLGILGSTSFKTYSISKPSRHCHNLISDFRIS